MNKYKFLGYIIYIIFKLVNITTKKYYYIEIDNIEQFIVVFWHRKIFSVCNATRNINKKASMVSTSKDGDLLTVLLKKEGNELIRGSSNRDNVKSLKETLRYIKKGYAIGIAIDGPKGPIYEPKPGAIYLSQKTGVEIIPVASYTNKKWILNRTWDKLEIPMPFSKTMHYVGKPLKINKDMELDEAIQLVKIKINEAEKIAEKLFNEKQNKNRKRGN